MVAQPTAQPHVAESRLVDVGFLRNPRQVAVMSKRKQERLATSIDLHSYHDFTLKNKAMVLKRHKVNVLRIHFSDRLELSTPKFQNCNTEQYSSNPSALISRLPCSSSSTRALLLPPVAMF
jgi:hypothetical protein